MVVSAPAVIRQQPAQGGGSAAPCYLPPHVRHTGCGRPQRAAGGLRDFLLWPRWSLLALLFCIQALSDILGFTAPPR